MVSCGISTAFAALSPCEGLVAHALLTRPPLERTRIATHTSPLDLHVLGTPPAFVLSQNQTLVFKSVPQAQFLKPDLLKYIDCRSLFLLLCIVFKVQRPFGEPMYNITLSGACQLLLF